jgi:DNA-binding transcriptional LysR family regulator
MLAAFDAAARHESFSRAARELNLTQGAISRQVTALEHQLEVQLFGRSGKGVELTEVGRSYAVDIQAVLAALRSASVKAISSPFSHTLNLAILPTFGTRWLMPRFPGFLEKHPDITVNFVTRLSKFDFETENIDAAIHFGSMDWPETECTFLMGEESIPVCSPDLLDRKEQIALTDVIELPLLHLETRPNAWQNWFSMNQLRVPANTSGMLFEQFSIITQAAVAGIGVALLPMFLIRKELDRGELVALSDKPYTDDQGYYLVTPVEKVDYAPVVAFREWLDVTIDRGK